MRRKVFSRSVSINVLRRSWQDGGDGESPSTATADESQTSESPILAIEDATIPTSPILGEDMPTYPESESDSCAEILSEDGTSPYPDGNECIDLDDSDVDMPYPSAGSAAAEEAHKTIDVAQQRKQTLKKKPATNAPVDSVVCVDDETVHAVNPDQHIARDCLRVVYKKERGKEFWVINNEKHQLMQVTVAMAGSNGRAKALCTVHLHVRPLLSRSCPGCTSAPVGR